MYVAKESLRVDPTYQRNLNDGKRLRIAQNFNYAAFGVLLVARRPDGTLWVMDGQHRLAAAMSRSDVRNLPVIIFDFGGSISDEAADFRAANKERKPLTGLDTFKADVVAGDPIAIAVRDLVLESGRVVGDMPDGRSVRCVGTLNKCMALDAAALRRIWPIVVEMCAGRSIDSRLVTAMHTLERQLTDSDDADRSLCEADNRRKLVEAGAARALQSIGDAAAYYHRGGDRVFAVGLLNLLNHRRRKTLRMRGSDSEFA